MIRRILNSLRRRGKARVERFQQILVAPQLRRALELRAPERPASIEDEGREVLARLARLLPLGHVLRFALQADSPAGYDVLALRASRGRLLAADVAALGHSLTGAAAIASRAALAHLHPGSLVALARALQEHGHPDAPFVLDAALAVQRRSRRGDSIALALPLLLAGRAADAEHVLGGLSALDWTGERLLGDVINPFVGHSPAPLERWQELASRIYRGSSVEAFVLDAGTASDVPFDRLTAPVAAGSIEGGPLVSVIMSTFRPGPEALVSARSILAQSWRHLELLVMDDASGPEYDEILAALAALDNRVRVVRSADNGGTYRRRNHALGLARGEFVTMQDSDDWSHPRRLELQARHLEAHPMIPANLVVSLRVTEQMQFVQRRGPDLRLCEPAIMFRRADVTARIGVFDSVRKSADSEFRVRIAQTWGGDPPVILPRTPLMLMRSDSASLSGSDFGGGWTAPVRFVYRSAYLQWQRNELRQGRDPRMSFPQTVRPFPAPARIEGRQVERQQWDIVVAGDARPVTLHGASPRISAVLEQIDERGRVAFLQLASMRSPHQLVLTGALQQLVNDGALGVVAQDDEADAGLLILAHADAALGLPRVPLGIRPRRVVVIVDSSEMAADGRGYAADLVEESIVRAFGVAPEWASAVPR